MEAWRFVIEVNSICTQNNSELWRFPVVFRGAVAGDMEGIHATLHLGFQEFSKLFAPSALKLTPSCIRASLSSWRVISVNNNLLGCAMAYREEDFFTFCYMTIAPGYRQAGLGKAFVEELGSGLNL